MNLDEIRCRYSDVVRFAGRPHDPFERANMLRLKMSVASVKSCADGNGNKTSEEITMHAVYGDKGTANAQWSKWTPVAGLSMTINNPEAFGKLLPGQFVFCDLSPAGRDD